MAQRLEAHAKLPSKAGGGSSSSGGGGDSKPSWAAAASKVKMPSPPWGPRSSNPGLLAGSSLPLGAPASPTATLVHADVNSGAGAEAGAAHPASTLSAALEQPLTERQDAALGHAVMRFAPKVGCVRDGSEGWE